MTDPSLLVLTADFTILQQHICHYDPVHSFQLYLRSPHQLVSCVTVFPEDVCTLYYSVSSIMTPGFMSPSATFIASDILLLPLMDDNIPLNKPEQNLNLCHRWNVNLCVFCFSSAGLPLHLHPQPARRVCHLWIARSHCCWCGEKLEVFL